MELKARSRLGNHLVTLLTLGTLLPLLLVRLVSLQSLLFWIYTFLVTAILLTMYAITNNYHPQPDNGYRPKVTVIVPVKNEEQLIEPVIRAIFASNYPSNRLDAVVVDDGSTDKTWEHLQRIKRDPEITTRIQLVRHEKNYGKRVALASGAAQATGEIIVCVDSDSFVDPDAIANLVQPFQDERVTASCGHGEASNLNQSLLAKLQHYWYAEMFRLWKGMESRLGSVTCCSGILSAYRLSAVQPLLDQWLTERFPRRNTILDNATESFSLTSGLTRRLIKSPGEDRVLTAYALSPRDARVVYQSNAVVHTEVPATPGGFFRQQLRWMRSWVHCSIIQGRFMWKKPPGTALIYYLYQFLAYLSPVVIIVWLVLRPLQGEWLGTVGFLAGTLYVGFLHGLNTWRFLRTSIASVPYRTLFVFMSLFLTLTVLIYGWATPWKGGWLTREQPGAKPLSQPTLTPVQPNTTPASPIPA